MVLLIALAGLLVASAALAAKPQTGTANLTSLAASGITGTAELRVENSGLVRVHETLSGLSPGVTYTSRVFSSSATCGAGPSVMLQTFTANGAGKASFNVVAPPQVGPSLVSASISVQQGTAVLSCGEIIFQ